VSQVTTGCYRLGQSPAHADGSDAQGMPCASVNLTNTAMGAHAMLIPSWVDTPDYNGLSDKD